MSSRSRIYGPHWPKYFGKLHALNLETYFITGTDSQTQGPSGLRQKSAADLLLGLWVQILMDVCLVWILRVEIPAMGRSLVESSPTDCAVFKWMWLRKLKLDGPSVHGGLLSYEKKNCNGILMNVKLTQFSSGI
jgi:hypothetical protein